MANLTFFKLDRVIQVDVGQTEVTIQDLVNQIRGYEDELDFFDYGHICNAYGKQSLGGGVQIGITLELINNWRIQFESPGVAPTITVYVRGGNLVAINDYSNNPIKASDYVTVIVAQSTAPSIITPASDDHLIYLVNSLRGKQRQSSNFYYWNPTPGLGSDSNDGTTPGKAVATFAQAQTLASAGTGDTIFCLASNSSGTTTVTETLDITKANLKVLGPGQAFRLIPTATTAPTVTIAASGVEVSGFYVGTAATGTQDAISITTNNAFIQDCWIANVRGHGINVSSSSRTQIQSCVIEHCGGSGTGDGIKLGNTTTEAYINRCIIFDNKNGVSLAGTGLADNILENNLIYQHSSYGITIGAGVLRTHVRSGHSFNKNTAGNTYDEPPTTGKDTYIETGGAVTTEDRALIADAVWDEVISGHLTAGTAGKTLKDAKTKATLASLK